VEGSGIRGILEVPAGRLAYETSGRGPPVLFLHAGIADNRMWDREFSLYSTGHHTVRFDRRGFGGSSPASSSFSYEQDLKSLISHLRLRRPYLVGASMGGAIAIDYTLENPEMVRGLFLVAPGISGGLEPPFAPEEQAAYDNVERRSEEVTHAWSKGDASRAFELLRQLWCPALEGPSLKLFHEMVEQNAPEVFESRSERLAESVQPPAFGRLGRIKAPTTVLVGDRDNPAAGCIASRIVRSIPGAHLVKVHGADHLLNLSRPDAFDAAFRSALVRPG
jgi:pimeloyl-ACP methyl ester carboxylesterase